MFCNSQTCGATPQMPNFGGANSMMSGGMNSFGMGQSQAQMNSRQNYGQAHNPMSNANMAASSAGQNMNRSMTPNAPSMTHASSYQSYSRPQPVRVDVPQQNPYQQQQQMYGMNQQAAMQQGQNPYQMSSNPFFQYNGQQQQQYQQQQQQQPTYRMH